MRLRAVTLRMFCKDWRRSARRFVVVVASATSKAPQVDRALRRGLTQAQRLGDFGQYVDVTIHSDET